MLDVDALPPCTVHVHRRSAQMRKSLLAQGISGTACDDGTQPLLDFGTRCRQTERTRASGFHPDKTTRRTPKLRATAEM